MRYIINNQTLVATHWWRTFCVFLSSIPHLAIMYPAKHSKKTSRIDCPKQENVRHYGFLTRGTLAVKTVWRSGRNVSDDGDFIEDLLQPYRRGGVKVRISRGLLKSVVTLPILIGFGPFTKLPPSVIHYSNASCLCSFNNIVTICLGCAAGKPMQNSLWILWKRARGSSPLAPVLDPLAFNRFFCLRLQSEIHPLSEGHGEGRPCQLCGRQELVWF